MQHNSQRNRSRRTALLAITTPFVVISLALAGCGDDVDTVDTIATTPTGDATPETVADETTLPSATTAETVPPGTAASDTGPTETTPGETATTATTGTDAVTTSTPAATLRAELTGLLSEHVYLAALASGAALRGDNAGFEAFANALNGPSDSNSSELVEAITSVYGTEVGTAFDGLWRSENHIPAFVRYAQAKAADDTAAADQAVADLTEYAKTFGDTMNQVNENLPAAAVTEAITMHATTLIAVIDAQKAGDQPQVYASLREAYAHMAGTAKALASGTAAKFPDQITGDASSPAADLRAGLTLLMREHVLLATSATGGAIAGRQPHFEAAAAALNGAEGSNSADLVAAVRAAYGDEVGTAFDGLWRSENHIPAFVRYAQAKAADDTAAADQAVADLTEYAKTFGDTMNQVNENLPAAAVTEAITMHATTLIAVIDAQKAGDAPGTAKAVREAVHHMSGTADVLAGATAKKFPDKFIG